MRDWVRSSHTSTCVAQDDVEQLLKDFLGGHEEPAFLRSKHVRFVSRNLGPLPQSIQGLHCSQPWLVYWTLQAADLLGITSQLLQTVPACAIVEFLQKCFTAEESDVGDNLGCGGFSGGPEQLPHLATTYAAVMSLCILSSAASDPSILSAVDSAALSRWFLSLRSRDGGFSMHRGGECDVRASYCVAVVASVLPLPNKDDLLGEHSAKFVASCQTFEGGLACSPVSTEAHGGYTQCGLAALLLMQGFHLIDVHSLKNWLANRQFEYEGGFNGRTNKLVDSCYSHWIGSSHVLLRAGMALLRSSSSEIMSAEDVYVMDLTQLLDATTLHVPKVPEMMKRFDSAAARFVQEAALTQSILDAGSQPGSSFASNNIDEEAVSSGSFADIPFVDEEVGDYLFNQRKLQNFVLRCCQNPDSGGLMDKPEHPNDFYHTCYAMSGVSSAQNLQYLYHVRQCAAAGPVQQAGVVDGGVAMTDYVTCSLERDWVQAMKAGDKKNSGAVTAIDETASSVASVKLALLRPTNPIFNITKERVAFALRHALGRPSL